MKLVFWLCFSIVFVMALWTLIAYLGWWVLVLGFIVGAADRARRPLYHLLFGKRSDEKEKRD